MSDNMLLTYIVVLMALGCHQPSINPLGGSTNVIKNVTASDPEIKLIKAIQQPNLPRARHSMLEYYAIVPSSEIYHVSEILLSVTRDTDRRSFAVSQTKKFWKRVFVAGLLLLAGIEPNPGPATSSTIRKSAVNLGLLNSRSTVSKTALIHDIIDHHHLDMLAVTETWVYDESPDVHKKETAPPGFSITHSHRDVSSRGGNKKHGGGVALIHREDIRVKVIPHAALKLSTFDLLLAKITNCTVGVMLAIIYRPPHTKVPEFIAELSDLIDSGILGTRYIICGDLNCPGPTGSKGLIGKELEELIKSYSLTHHVKNPTHQSGNILDHILSSDEMLLIENVIVEDQGYLITS